jgi:hypothetical protein
MLNTDIQYKRYSLLINLGIKLFIPPLLKGGKGGFENREKIPLNPPFSKGDVIGYIT